MKKKQLIEIWKRFAEKNAYQLNPDASMVEMLADGILENEKKHGLKLCPCRLRDSTRERDLELICPCNFKIQEVWKEKGMCHCGLFVKKE